MDDPLRLLERDLESVRSVWSHARAGEVGLTVREGAAGVVAAADSAGAGGASGALGAAGAADAACTAGAADAANAACTAGAADAANAAGTADAAAMVTAMADGDLVAAADALSGLLRTGEALLARVAGEIARRSPAELGKDGLAKKQGFLNPAHLIAASTGGDIRGAGRLVAVGTATAHRASLTGEQLPPAHPHVAEALSAGAISVEAAAAITRMLDRVAPRAQPDLADSMERILAENARTVPLDLLNRMVREAEARLDQDGVEPREEQLRSDRSLSIHEDVDGMIRIRARLDPETAAPIRGAIEAIVTHGIRTSRGHGAQADPVIADDRTLPQRQADALAMIARHALGCSRVPAAPATTVVVRTDLAALTEGVGHARIDGIDQPVSASTVRRQAASAGIIPAVLGTESLPLDLGRTARLFSPAQRIALGERDGGCACCGLDVAYAEAHHIAWWERDAGPTDLDNGVLLCPSCHTRVHNDGWTIEVRRHQVWFIPPPHVDIDRTPRLGGRARFCLPRDAAVAV